VVLATAPSSLITFNNNNACVQGVTIGNDIQRVKSDTVNGPEMKISGVDVSIDYRNSDVFGGAFNAGVSVSYLLKYDVAEFSVGGALVSTAYKALGYTNYDRFPGTVSRFRGNAFAEYGFGAHNLRADLTYVDGAVDNRAPISVQNSTGALQLVTIGMKVEDFYTVDLNYRVQLPWDTTITASVFNLFDRDPSAARLEVTYDPFIGNPYGRTFKVGVRKKF